MEKQTTKLPHEAWASQWYRMVHGVRWQLSIPRTLVKLSVARQLVGEMRRTEPADLLTIEQSPVTEPWAWRAADP